MFLKALYRVLFIKEGSLAAPLVSSLKINESSSARGGKKNPIVDNFKHYENTLQIFVNCSILMKS